MNLFEPDNFSVVPIIYTKANIDFERLQTILSHYFDYCTVTSVHELQAPAFHTDNFQVAAIIDGVSRTLLVRRYKHFDLAKIEFFLSLVADLDNRGVPVTRFFVTKGGTYSYRITDECYAVGEFINGTHFLPTEANWCETARAVAAMHSAFSAWNPDILARIDQFSRSGYTYFNKILAYTSEDVFVFEHLVGGSPATLYRSQILEKMPLLALKINDTLAHKADIVALPRQPIHSDLHPHNILVTSGRELYLLDFDALRIAEQARDVAFAIYRLGRQFFAQGIFSPLPAEAARLRDVFIAAYEEVKPLTPLEKQLMKPLLMDEFIRKILFVFASVYREKNTTYEKEIPKFLAAIEEIDYFWP